MKHRYKMMEDVYFENRDEMDPEGFHIFDLVFDGQDKDKSYQCHFRDECHLLHFIEILNKDV